MAAARAKRSQERRDFVGNASFLGGGVRKIACGPVAFVVSRAHVSWRVWQAGLSKGGLKETKSCVEKTGKTCKRQWARRAPVKPYLSLTLYYTSRSPVDYSP